MKSIKGFSLFLCLLLVLIAALTACDSKTPADTTAADTTASAETPTEAPTEVPTEAPTEAETAPPADLSAEELKALLSAALAKDTENAAATVKTYMGDEMYMSQTVVQIGDDFVYDVDSMGMKNHVIVLGEQVYYYVSMNDGETVTELRYVFTPTAEERAELLEGISAEGTSTGLEVDVIAGILNSTMAGKRYADGTVELTCTGLSDDLIGLLMGEPMEGATLSFAFTLDAEERMTFMRFTIELPAELTGGEAMTVTSETVVNYDPAPITAPADADQYAAATYDELFGIVLPDPDYEEVAGLGLPVDGDNYTIGGENSAHDPVDQMAILYLYAHAYENKTFTLYGNLIETEDGNLVVSVGEDLEIPVYWSQGSAPTVGSYVKVTGVFTRTVDMGDYMDFDCFTMMVSATEVLGEAKGPNGGRLMYITASSLNVRTSSDTSSNDNIIGTYSKGDLVEVFEQDAKGWYRVSYNGQTAYISNKYVSETKP